VVLITVVVLWACAAPAQAQSLALVDEVEWKPFREHVGELLAGLKKLDAEVPAETTKAVQKLIDQKSPDNPRVAARAVQKLLDAHCLVGVHINPQSRVKAARGDLAARLVRDRTTYVLVRVHNDGGVTHPLSAVSEQAVLAGSRDADRWLELGVINDRPFANRLSGQRLEYRVLKLVARQTGKREATVTFDVGQGTQDLGFRSDVPILFTVRPR
jgi:hypothetical protein